MLYTLNIKNSAIVHLINGTKTKAVLSIKIQHLNIKVTKIFVH